MIGFVSPELRPIIRIAVRGLHGREVQVDAWVDTGFDGVLVLQQDIIDELELPPDPAMSIQLADGSQVEAQCYRAAILWDDREENVHVVSTQGFTLVGLHLLHQHNLKIALTDGGAVTIEPLS